MRRGLMTATLARRAFITLALVILAVFPLVSGNLYDQTLLILTFLLAIGASGWNIIPTACSSRPDLGRRPGFTPGSMMSSHCSGADRVPEAMVAVDDLDRGDLP